MNILLLLIVLLGATNTFLMKKFQVAFEFSSQNFLWYNFLNAVVATIVFFIMCGFKIQTNMTTTLFALGYACMVLCSLGFSVLALSVLTIPVSSVLASSGSLLLGSCAGIFIFNEKTDVFTFISIATAFCACLLPFVNYKKGEFSFKSLVISIFYFLICGMSTIYIKLYVTNPNTNETNQLFFLTNVFLCVISFTGILIVKKVKNQNFKNIVTSFKASQLINISSRTVINNITSILSATVLAMIPLTTYNIVMPAFSMLATLGVSLIIFKERIKPRQILALILMLTASVLCNM